MHIFLFCTACFALVSEATKTAFHCILFLDNSVCDKKRNLEILNPETGFSLHSAAYGKSLEGKGIHHPANKYMRLFLTKV